MLIDMVLNRIVKGKSREIDVAATLEHLRDQRANVVENKVCMFSELVFQSRFLESSTLGQNCYRDFLLTVRGQAIYI